jgi:hypothetical protein
MINSKMKNQRSLVTLSSTLLHNVKLNNDTTAVKQQLRVIPIQELQQQLNCDNTKKIFWINIYNAYFQMLTNLENTITKSIFTEKSITIADNKFSLDDIEHGILRRYKWKWSFGYLPNPFATSLIKTLAVKTIDYRIHFALNCGAKSCPPIAFYSLEKLEEELHLAMESFLYSETSIDDTCKIVSTSKLLYWYCGDFGGFSKIKNILEALLNKDLATYKLTYNTYSWETQLNNFTKH